MSSSTLSEHWTQKKPSQKLGPSIHSIKGIVLLPSATLMNSSALIKIENADVNRKFPWWRKFFKVQSIFGILDMECH